MNVRNFELKTLRCKASIVRLMRSYRCGKCACAIYSTTWWTASFRWEDVSSSVSYYLISLHPSKVCPLCETDYCTTKAECVLLVLAVQGFCCFCSLPYTFRYVFVNPFMGSDYYAERILWAGILYALMKCYILRTSCFSVMIIKLWLLEHAHRHCRNPKSV